MKVLPTDPRAGYLAHRAEIDSAMARVLEGGWYILGEEVRAFESEFARYVEREGSVGVGSGTEAIHLALLACGLGLGDGVVTVSHTAVATVAAIELAGATPVLVDIDPETFTLDPARLEATIEGWKGPPIKAVVPVHLYGHPVDMRAVMDIATRHGLVVIEDCAQSHGASRDGGKAGRWGTLAAFSFYPTKNLGALGDAGAVVGDGPTLDRVRELREYGWRERFISEFPGLNSRMDELQAAVLRVKLPHLDRENARRRDIAGRYTEALTGTSIAPPVTAQDTEHVFHLYVVRAQDREGLRRFLETNEVLTGIHYPVPVHLQPAYRGRVAPGAGGLGVTEQVCREILSLPMHPHLSDAEVELVGRLAKDWGGRG